jgi:hypothetical protein
MNSINVNIPIVNIPHVTQHQQDIHRVPMVHQTQNADISRDRFDRQLQAPNETEETEGKIVDPKDKKEEEGKKRKRDGQSDNEEKKTANPEESTIAVTMLDSGQLIDLEA